MDKLMPIILDESVEYRIYFANDAVDEDFALAAASSITSKLTESSRDWLWHCEEFNLELVKSSVSEDGKSSVPVHLYGLTHFGDNLDDEWLIVYMLLLATESFQDLVVTIEDSDGQLLLIETANVLPRWLTPERVDNRIFLHKGCMHIIPEARHPGEVGVYPVGTPTIPQAIQLVSSDAIATKADKAVQDCLRAKLSMFPDQIRTSRHLSQCTLPVSAGHVLVTDPSLVAPAVQAFYTRDPLQMRTCRTMKHFAPAAKPEDSVRVNVSFTKCLYAQLRRQRYRPGVKSGWRVPPPSDPDFVGCDLGMKLCYGLEILRRQAPKTVAEASSSSSSSSAAAEQESEEDVCVGPRWDTFVSSLKQRDYFRGEMEGSKEHRRLTAEAKQYYASLLAKEDAPSKDTLRRSTQVGQRIKHILDDVPIDADKLHRLSADVVPADSEEWMAIDQEQLDKLLNQYRFGPDATAHAPSASSSAASASHISGSQRRDVPSDPGAEEMQSLVASMKQFVSGIAGPEGAEFPAVAAAADDNDGSVQFSADGFASAISSLLGIGGGGDGGDDMGSDDSDFDLADDLDIGDFDGDDADEPADGSAMKSYYEEMDRQLARTDLGSSFERSQAGAPADRASDLPPVDIDMNLVKNLLASYGAQEGLAGPAANILHGMGLQMPSVNPSS